MTLTSQVEAIREQLRTIQADMPESGGLAEAHLAELNALWMSIEAVATSIDEDKRALGL
jgi:hypothetical protein